MLIKVGNDLFRILELHHLTPGNKRAHIQCRMRNIRTHTLADEKFRAEEDIERATLDEREMQYLYSDNEGHILMDLETYDQNTIPKAVFGDDIKYLKPNTTMTALFHDGKIVSYDLPKTVDLEVTDTAPGIKGATATNQMKDAECETGLKTRVPPFIVVGEVVRISTESGQYMSRA